MANNRTAVRRILCRDAGNKCNATFEGRDAERLVGQAIEHMAHEHGASLTPEFAAQVRTLIKQP